MKAEYRHHGIKAVVLQLLATILMVQIDKGSAQQLDNLAEGRTVTGTVPDGGLALDGRLDTYSSQAAIYAGNGLIQRHYLTVDLSVDQTIRTVYIYQPEQPVVPIHIKMSTNQFGIDGSSCFTGPAMSGGIYKCDGGKTGRFVIIERDTASDS